MWKERVAAIEQIESQLSLELSTHERKARFAPHATAFLGFIIAYIKDADLKISVTAINMTNKLLVLEIPQVSQHYNDLARALIEKLSDSKVVIRRAVLKCCGVLIRGGSPCQFANYAIGYLGHTNWYVREGILVLLANCLIVQGQQEELNPNAGTMSSHGGTQAQQQAVIKDLAVNPILIGQLCHMMQNETKTNV